MLETKRFCPECGAEMGDATVCVQCGYDSIKVSENNTEKPMNASMRWLRKLQTIDKTALWPRIENYVQIVGKYSWIFAFVGALVFEILAFVSISSRLYANAIWDVIITAVDAICLFIYVYSRFGKKAQNKEWQWLVDDVLKVGLYRIPWMLIFGVILEVFGYWSGLGVPLRGNCYHIICPCESTVESYS